MGKVLKKLKLHGFNNLTKTLSFNIYDICYAKTPAARRDYIEYIDDAYNAKSPTTVTTYPESHPDNGISTFRADIDVSTCGRISPLRALNYLIHSFESDIVTIDYRVRGFPRDIKGQKFFIDHKINSIQNYIARDTRERYQMIDVNVYQENIFHTKMLLKEFELQTYLFG